MGTRFDRRLARPATIRALRHILRITSACPSNGETRRPLHTRCCHRSTAAPLAQQDWLSGNGPPTGLAQEWQDTSSDALTRPERAAHRKRPRSRPRENDVQARNKLDRRHDSSYRQAAASFQASRHHSCQETLSYQHKDKGLAQEPVNNSAAPALSQLRSSGVNTQSYIPNGTRQSQDLSHRQNLAVMPSTSPTPTVVNDETLNIEELAAFLESAGRQAGFAAVMAALPGLIDRRAGIPVTGPSAEKAWDALLEAAMKDSNADQFRELLYRYAFMIKNETGQQYRHLHTRMVGHYLRHSPQGSTQDKGDALYWHRRFVHDGMARQEFIVPLIGDIIQSVEPLAALEQWQTMYLLDSRRRLHRRCLLKLQPGTALYEQMQAFLLAVGDKPSSVAGPAGLAQTQSAKPLSGTKTPSPLLPLLPPDSHMPTGSPNTSASSMIPRHGQTLAEEGTRSVHIDHGMKTSFDQDSSLADARQQAEDKVDEALFSRSKMSLALGAVHGISEKHLGDEFCARVFATRLFPFSMSITSLRILGVDRIGPLSIREIAQRSHRPEDFLNRLKQVKAEGIALGDSVFLRLLQLVATQNDDKGYHALLQSDQHPENYNDAELQTKLLYEYENAKQWILVQLSLQALALNGVRTEMSTWNVLLRRKIAERDMGAIRQCYHSMCVNGIPATPNTLMCIRSLLPPRAVSQRETHTEDAEKKRDFVASAHMRATELGLIVRPEVWTDLLKRYGMEREIDKLARCIVWLAGLTACNTETLTSSHPIGLIFCRPMQKAIVWWPWRTAIERRWFWKGRPDTTDASVPQTQNRLIACPSESWARGIAMLRDLREKGIKIRLGAVREAIRQQLWIIFGPGYAKHKSNDLVASRNPISLAEYVKHVNSVWPGIFPVHESLLAGATDTHAALLVAVFGKDRRLSRADGLYTDCIARAKKDA